MVDSGLVHVYRIAYFRLKFQEQGDWDKKILSLSGRYAEICSPNHLLFAIPPVGLDEIDALGQVLESPKTSIACLKALTVWASQTARVGCGVNTWYV